MTIENEIETLLRKLRSRMKDKFNRHVSIQDLLSDRWETARFYGFGNGTSCYNNVLILGDVDVGENTWIGPNVILDGTGGLKIGDYVSISSGVQIYTTIQLSEYITRRKPIVKKSTKIENGVYLGPNSIIQMGVNIGDKATIGAMSFVNKDIPMGRKWYKNHLIDID